MSYTKESKIKSYTSGNSHRLPSRPVPWIWFALFFVLLGVMVYMFISFAVGHLVQYHHQEPVSILAQPPQIDIYQEPYRLTNIQEVRIGCEYWNGVIDSLEATDIEKSWLKHIIFCESTCNPNAVSYMGASGLAQFLPSTYRANGGVDIWNGYEQLDVALKMYRMGQAYQWCCNKSF